MPGVSRIRSTAGFSLAEALVALAIAAFLVAVLARFALGIRANALEVRQQVVMDILGKDLLERYTASELKPGRIDGRSGALAWRLNVTPLTYSAHAQSISQEKPPESVQPPPSEFSLTQSKAPTDSKPQPKIIWNPYHVTVAITSPSGRSYAIDTVRIGPQAVEDGIEDTRQR